MRGLDVEVVDAIWAAVESLVPTPIDEHPLGCHNPRIADRVCFEAILYRLVLGCSWETVEQLMNHVVSDTTMRSRRDEWVTAGVFDQVADEALEAYDRIIGLDLSECSVDGSQHKAPCGGPGRGPNPTDSPTTGSVVSSLSCEHDPDGARCMRTLRCSIDSAPNQESCAVASAPSPSTTSI